MAYSTKYRFRFESVHGVVYEVRLLENGYSGSVKDRPLGAAPIIKMQDADAIRATSCDLVLECQTDGEYVDLYTTDPFQYKVEIYHKTGSSSFTIFWSGFVATEIYSEPDIAPPYDVRITATDGLGTLKEYTFEEAGPQTLRKHLQDLLKKTGDPHPYIYMASQFREYGDTAANFLDKALVDLDFLAGENCYEVLNRILTSLRCVLTYRYYWLIIREVDIQITSGGVLSVLEIPLEPDESTTTGTISLGKTVGKMGVAQMWPVGYLTRRVSPAKKSVTVRAPWNFKNAFPKVGDNAWSLSGGVSFVSAGGYLSYTQPSSGVAMGRASASLQLFQFVTGIRVRIKATAWAMNMGQHKVTVQVIYGSNSYSPSDGWTTNPNSNAGSVDITNTSDTNDPNEAQVVDVVVPSLLSTSGANLIVKVSGFYVNVFDIEVIPETVAGYEDHLVIDNGARGEKGTVDLAFGNLTGSNYQRLEFLRGIFYTVTQGSGSTTYHPIMAFSDGDNTNKGLLSIVSISYAKELAFPRIEISGKLDNPYASPMGLPPMFVKSHGVWALLSSYEWNLAEEDIDFKAISIPSTAVTVDSETISSLVEGGGRSSSGGSSSGGGGGGGHEAETDPVFSASPAYGITAEDISSWRGKQGLPSLEQSDNGKTLVAVDGLWEKGRILPTVDSSDNGKVLKVVSGAWAKGTDAGYVKPSGGIPSSDMAGAVQTSLGKADSALQAVPSDYKKVVFCASEAAYNAITPKDSDTLYLIAES